VNGKSDHQGGNRPSRWACVTALFIRVVINLEMGSETLRQLERLRIAEFRLELEEGPSPTSPTTPADSPT
jgi:hypothetical protein